MAVVLGIDAAWTRDGSTGVALVAGERGGFRLLRAASSYRGFMQGTGVPFAGTAGGLPDAAALLRAAERLSGAAVDVVAVDMPMSTVEFSARRAADDRIASAFGAQKVGTHTPNAERPGALGRHISGSFARLGFPLATSAGRRPQALIEVYPHTALVRLMHCAERRKYKAAKTTKYWKGKSIAERIGLLVGEWNAIVAALGEEIDCACLNLPSDFPTLSAMKEHEDRLDAVISAWAGVKYLLGEAEPHGDDTAAIWVPD